MFALPFFRRNSEGVRIISNSYGCKTSDTPSCYSQMFERSIQAFDQQGGLFVVSAGNDGVSNDQVGLRNMHPCYVIVACHALPCCAC